jgi:hypothetical protein
MNAGPLRRIAYSFLGLLAGNAFLLLWSLGLAIQYHNQFSVVLLFSPIYFIFSAGGWAVMGIPLALAIPARVIVRMSWWVLLIGAGSGPISLLLIFVMMSRGRFDAGTFMSTGVFSMFALVISTTASGVYSALLRRRLQGNS